MPTKVLLILLVGISILLAGLLTLVIIVSLARDNLDSPSAVASILASALTGVIGGIVLKLKASNEKRGGGDDEE